MALVAVVERDGEVEILDFKTGLVETQEHADRRTHESLQLDLYALAHLRTKGRLPDRVELRFLESGLSAGRSPGPDDVSRTEERIRVAADGIRRRDFHPRPTWMACGLGYRGLSTSRSSCLAVITRLVGWGTKSS